MICVNCRSIYQGKPLQKIPRNSTSGDSRIGICPECLDDVYDFSKKSQESDRESKIKKISIKLRTKYNAFLSKDEKEINIPKKETIVKFFKDYILVHSKHHIKDSTRISFNGEIKEGLGDKEIVSDVQNCLLSNAEDFVLNVCPKYS